MCLDLFWYLLCRQKGGGGKQLYAPTISRGGDTLTVTDDSRNGSFTQSFQIYNGNKKLVLLELPTNTLDLTSLDDGDYTLTATAVSKGMKESEKSNSISVAIYSAEYTFTDITATPTPAKILSGSPVTIALSTSGTYVLPDSVSVVGATAVYTRTNDTSGTLVLSDPTGEITVSAAALEKLAAPTISVTDDTLTIETTDFATQNYEIYADDTLVDTIPR